MIKAAFKAAGDLLSPEFRSVLLTALGLTLALFIVVFVGTEYLVTTMTLFSWPWADQVLAIGTGLLMLVAFFFLMSPVTAAFAGLFLDKIAARIEARHYPVDAPGVALTAAQSVAITLRFFVVVLAINLVVLPMVFLGIGVFVLVAVNAYLIGREYFEMAAMRYMPVEDARLFRRENSVGVFLAGILPALLALLPVVNLAVPLFATAYFVHLVKSLRLSSA